MPRTDGEIQTAGVFSLTFLEAGSSRSGLPMIPILVGASSWAADNVLIPVSPLRGDRGEHVSFLL